MAASTITNFKRYPLGNGGDWLVTFTYTPATNYSSGGDNWTAASIKQVMEGISSLTALAAQPLFRTADGGSASWCAFQPINDGTNCGKFHIYNAVDAHTHGLLLTGGQAAGVAMQITPDSNAAVIGKTTATNFTAAGGTSNILNSTAATASNDNTGPTDYSAFTCQFIGVGRM